MSQIGHVTLRFLVLGLLNTSISFALFIGLSFLMHPALAYSVAFVSVLTIVTFASNRWVFRGEDSWRRRFSYLMCYVTIFLLAQVTIALMDPFTLLDLVVTSAVILSFSIPLTIACGRRAFKPNTLPATEAKD